MNLRKRVARLEKEMVDRRVDRQIPSLVFLDDQGHILDDGSEIIRSWTGKHFSALPQGQPIKVWLGFSSSEIIEMFRNPNHAQL
jgi:hypothetical protein